MKLLLQGLGTAVPECSIQQSDAAEIAKTLVYGSDEGDDPLPALYRMTKVQKRSSVLLEPPNGDRYRQTFYPASTAVDDRGPATETRMMRYVQEATPLAVTASQRAMDAAQILPDAITNLITVSCTGFYSPGVEFDLIKQLGLSPSIARLNVGFMGCHGGFNGMGAAQAFAAANPQARVLMCCVELCTLHYSYGWDKQKIVANALFADGAAAMVGCLADGSHESGNWCLAARGSYMLPDSEDAMTWRIGDHGFEMTLSPRVPGLIQEQLKPWLTQWLKEQGISLDDVKSWAIHPGGPRLIQSVAVGLDLPRKATAAAREILTEYGNMSSATVLFVIQRLQQQAAGRPCVAVGFGPGLVAEVALFV